tara:strand:+ start:3217 stop:4107 length:891 start_codon:yes stop_codon:yes gene_type:complete
MNAFVFPGQGSQHIGMGADLYNSSQKAQQIFEDANEILGFKITDIMFGQDQEALKQTNITQPAIYIHSIVIAQIANKFFKPNAVAGHSLGEFTALAAAKYISFEDGLRLVQKRAIAMQEACEKTESSMAAIVGLEDKIVEDVCFQSEEILVAANYNCPGQIVISGTTKAINIACNKLTELGARRALTLPVRGAFHSPLMKSAEESLSKAINNIQFKKGTCPIYQNITGMPYTDIEIIKRNLVNQLTNSVKWTQTMENMKLNGLTSVTEVGPGKVLQGLFKRISRDTETKSLHQLIV